MRKMKITRFGIRAAFLLTAFCALPAVNAWAQKPANASTKPESSASVKADGKNIDFDFTDLSGKTRKFSEFRGKVVLIDFWATWCAPCLADIPRLKAIYEKHKADGFEIVGMNVETIGDDAEESPDAETAKENAANARRIVTTRGVNWTVATSESSVLVATKMFGVESLPAKILIDKDGTIIAAIGEKDDLSAIVEKLLGAN